jgi:hypothetical protein
VLADNTFDAICSQHDVDIDPLSLVVVFAPLDIYTIVIKINVYEGSAKVEGDARSRNLTPFI